MHYAELNAALAELTAPGAPFEIGETMVRGASLRGFRNARRRCARSGSPPLPFAARDYLVWRAIA